MTLRVHWTMACDGLDQKKPIFFRIVNHDVRHFSVTVYLHTEARQQLALEMPRLCAGIADVDQHAVRREAWSKFIDNVTDQFAVFSGAQVDRVPARETDRHADQFSFSAVAFRQGHP